MGVVSPVEVSGEGELLQLRVSGSQGQPPCLLRVGQETTFELDFKAGEDREAATALFFVEGPFDEWQISQGQELGALTKGHSYTVSQTFAPSEVIAGQLIKIRIDVYAGEVLETAASVLASIQGS